MISFQIEILFFLIQSMSFNDWFSVSHQPLSITAHPHPAKQQHYHQHFYHYPYASMATTTAHPLYSQCHHQCHHKPDVSNPFALTSPMPLMTHQVPLRHKENAHQTSTMKLRRCVSLFLHLIGSYASADFRSPMHVASLQIVHRCRIFYEVIHIFDMLIKYRTKATFTRRLRCISLHST